MKYEKKRMQKGGGMLDAFTQKANQLKDDAIKKSKDMGLHDKAADAHKAAIEHATAAQQMVGDAHSKAMTNGMELHSKMKPHLDLASGHANDALMHAQNKNMDGFKSSMGDFASSMTKAGSVGDAHVMNKKPIEKATLADHAKAVSGKAIGWMNSFTANKPAVPAPASTIGGRRLKSRKQPKKVKKSRTMKRNKYYNRRKHRQTKNAKMAKRRPRKTRKGGKTKNGRSRAL